MEKIAIAGAGISGLALAHALRVRGHDSLVLECEPRPGGKIRSELSSDFLCEWGPTSFLYSDPSLVALVRSVGLEGRLLRAGSVAERRWVVAGGKLSALPGSPGAFARSRALSARGKLRALADLVLPRGPSGWGQDESVAAFARRRLGRPAAERLFYPLMSAIYFADPERMSLPANFPWLAAMEREHRSLLLGALRAGGAGRGEALASFQGGMEELSAALAAALGPRLRLGARLRRVERRGERFVLHLEERGAASELETAALALAIPAHAAAPAVASLDAKAAGALEAIPYASLALVYAAYPLRALSHSVDAYGFFVPPTEPSRLLGAVFPSSLFAARAPGGMALILARVGGARHPELAALPDADLVELVQEELGGLLGAKGPPVFARIVRHPQALPQYLVGHAERVAVTEAAERRHPGLFFTGNAYRGLGIPECVRNAAPLAERVTVFLGKAGP